MKRTRNTAIILALAAAICCVCVSIVPAGSNDPVTEGWAMYNLMNRKKAVKIPVWQITQEGNAKSVGWVTHSPNPRFAIYDPDPGTPGNESDHLVLDRETGLVWARDADLFGIKTWMEAITRCRQLTLGDRQGWRLPTIEEFSSLADRWNYPRLPSGHPFINVPAAGYWSDTTYESNSEEAWILHTHLGVLGAYPKIPAYPYDGLHVWPVRGGNGYASGEW